MREKQVSAKFFLGICNMNNFCKRQKRQVEFLLNYSGFLNSICASPELFSTSPNVRFLKRDTSY